MIFRSIVHSRTTFSLKNKVLSTTIRQPHSFLPISISSILQQQQKRYYFKPSRYHSFKRNSQDEWIPINSNNKEWLNKKTILLLLSAGGSVGISLLYLRYNQQQQFSSSLQHKLSALHRFSVAAMVGFKVAFQYQWFFFTSQYNNYDDTIKELKKKECHLKGAQIVLDGLQRLGGVYVKLGQHVSAMMYLLPLEWTTTLSVLQDRCDPTSPEALKDLFLEDYGSSLDEVFDYFDWQPLGVASLAQVHRGHLRKKNDDSDGWVAIKIQHPRLDEFCQMDMDTVAFIIGMIKWWFPDFGFEWVLEEMQESLPQELDFTNEANNAYQVANNFDKDSTTALVIPKIIWAQRRILCMEYIKGARIDDLEFLREHNIDPSQVSKEITTIFSKMIFLHGFVHCDPHPGNLLIRPNNSKNKNKNKYNFEIVLLDHGIYRTLTDELRNDYAHLWTSLIRGDEKGIEYYAHQVGCKPPHHRLFASLLTGREWHTIEAANLSSTRTDTETNRVSGKTKLFLVKIADVLSVLPRIMLALLKTSDLLRHLDESLRQSSSSSPSGSYRTYAIMVEYCAQAVWLDTKKKLLSEHWGWTSWLSWCKRFIDAWFSFHLVEFYSWYYQ